MEQPLTQPEDIYTTPIKAAKEEQLSQSIYLGTADTNAYTPEQQTAINEVTDSIGKQQEGITDIMGLISDTRKKILSLSDEFGQKNNSTTQYTNNYSAYNTNMSPDVTVSPSNYIEIDGQIIPTGDESKVERLDRSSSSESAKEYKKQDSIKELQAQTYTPLDAQNYVYKQEIASASNDTIPLSSRDLQQADRTFEDLQNHPIKYITRGDVDLANPIESMSVTIDHMNQLLSQMRERHAQMNQLLKNSNWTSSSAYINQYKPREVESQSVQYREVVVEKQVKKSAPQVEKEKAAKTNIITLPSLPKMPEMPKLNLQETVFFKQIKTLFERKAQPVVVVQKVEPVRFEEVEKVEKVKYVKPDTSNNGIKKDEHILMRVFIAAMVLLFVSLLICQAIGLDDALYALDGM